MIDKEQVFSVVKMKGLVVPSDLVKDFHMDTLIMGAVLSDLVHDKKVGITSVKIGGSPVYYALENKEKLVDLAKYLHEKDKSTFQLLQEKKVLSDSMQQPLTRVSLRALKDYAKPIEVTSGNETKLFWKWYLATEQEVQDSLHTFFTQQVPLQQTQQFPLQPLQQPPLVNKPLQKKQKRIQQKKEQPSQQLSLPASTVVIPHGDSFAQQVAAFFAQKQAQLLRFSVVKKGEIDCVVDISTVFGSVRYFCKAKNKKRCTEGECATLFVTAQLEKLPALFVTTGVVSPNLLNRVQNIYPNMKIISI